MPILNFQEKPRAELIGCPYRKPTQVGEEKILMALERTLLQGTRQIDTVTLEEGVP